MILIHGSQFGDPKQQKEYWNIWREFEEAHGNEDTFREMLRIQRSVETAYANISVLPGFTAASTHGAQVDDANADVSMEPLNSIEAMARLAEEEALANADTVGQKRMFVRASRNEEGLAPVDEDSNGNTNVHDDNPDEIDIDEDMPVKKTVPSAVFGSFVNAMQA